MRHVIIGDGPAGVIAAETLRSNAPRDRILLIGREAALPYSRMDIPRVLEGAMPEAGAYLRRDPNHFRALRIERKRGTVHSIDTRERKVLMDDGSEACFDRLLIASGSSPVRPCIPGIGGPAVHTCWTLDDARRIARLAQPGSRVTLIGAGFIGCLVMRALVARGVRLTVLEKADRMLPNMLGAGAARMVRRWCEEKKVRVRVSTQATAIEPAAAGGPPLRIHLSGGAAITADLVVCAAGVKPNAGFLRASGIRCGQGILVDAAMQTSVKGIYAAGDCAEAYDHDAGGTVIAGALATACDQARCAALGMIGRRAFRPAVRHADAIDALGLACASIGRWRGAAGGQWVELADDRNFRFLRLEFDGDILIGSNHVGLADHATVLRDLVRHQVELGEWKDRLLRDPTRLKEAYRACAQRHYAGQAAATVIAHAARATH
jgi:NAD(P)H-nitrite reductase large subunit